VMCALRIPSTSISLNENFNQSFLDNWIIWILFLRHRLYCWHFKDLTITIFNVKLIPNGPSWYLKYRSTGWWETFHLMWNDSQHRQKSIHLKDQYLSGVGVGIWMGWCKMCKA
jgi:hypothetical protein